MLRLIFPLFQKFFGFSDCYLMRLPLLCFKFSQGRIFKVNTIHSRGKRRTELPGNTEFKITFFQSAAFIPDFDFKRDKQSLEALTQKILRTISKNKTNKNIISWNIGNPVFQNLSLYYQQSDLVHQQDAYLIWLKKLVLQMKNADPRRPITLDIEVSERMPVVVARISATIPGIASYGLVYNHNPPDYIIPTNFPHFISYAAFDVYYKFSGDSAGVFISNWQDTHTSERVSFDGVKDQTGRKKIEFLQLAAKWKGGAEPLKSPKIKILRPAAVTIAGKLLDYHAVIKEGENWSLAKNMNTNLKFEWKLVQMDDLHNLVSSKDVGTGPNLSLRIPYHSETYKLYLFVLNGDKVVGITNSSLHIPLQLPAKSSGDLFIAP